MTTIFHNPRCSKSRQTLALLEQRGIKPLVIEYLKTPPTKDELRTVLQKLGSNARDFMRKGEDEYKDMHLDNPELGEEQLLDAMIACPRLIERPIVVHNGKAALGRPPENVLDIL